MDKPITLVRRYVGTAEFYMQKADREYAYYKNDFDNGRGNKYTHYRISQECYEKAQSYIDRAKKIMKEDNIKDSSLSSRIRTIERKLKANKKKWNLI